MTKSERNRAYYAANRERLLARQKQRDRARGRRPYYPETNRANGARYRARHREVIKVARGLGCPIPKAREILGAMQ